VFIVVLDDSGQTLARRYVERNRLSDWLLHHGPDAARCEVFTEAPEKGGRRIAVLRRHVERERLSA
jgi:hypothetical protein